MDVAPSGDHQAGPQPGTVYSWCGLPVGGTASMNDFPLLACCKTCGRFTARETALSPWVHRADDAEPVTGPAEEGDWWEQ